MTKDRTALAPQGAVQAQLAGLDKARYLAVLSTKQMVNDTG